MLALWSVVWSFSFHQVSVCTVVDTAGNGALSCVGGTYPTCFDFVLFIPGMLNWRFLTIFSSMSSVGETSAAGVLVIVHAPERIVHWVYLKSLLVLCLLNINFISRVSCLHYYFLFSLSPCVAIIDTLMYVWLCLLAFLSFVSWLVSNCLPALVLDVDFLLSLLPVCALFHWFWHATWTLWDAASWVFHCTTLQHHLIIMNSPFLTSVFS